MHIEALNSQYRWDGLNAVIRFPFEGDFECRRWRGWRVAWRWRTTDCDGIRFLHIWCSRCVQEESFLFACMLAFDMADCTICTLKKFAPLAALFTSKPFCSARCVNQDRCNHS